MGICLETAISHCSDMLSFWGSTGNTKDITLGKKAQLDRDKIALQHKDLVLG